MTVRRVRFQRDDPILRAFQDRVVRDADVERSDSFQGGVFAEQDVGESGQPVLIGVVGEVAEYGDVEFPEAVG